MSTGASSLLHNNHHSSSNNNNNPGNGSSGMSSSSGSSKLKTFSVGLSCRKSIQRYFELIVNVIQGNKTLIMDDEVSGILSLVFTQSELLAKGVYMAIKLDKPHEPQPHLNCIVICRPTKKNVLLLGEELNKPAFGEYHVFFTNMITMDLLVTLAEKDVHQVVKQVQEFYMDYYSINDDLFTLNIVDSLTMSRPRPRWDDAQNACLDRSVKGILAILLSFQKRAVIRFSRSSDLAHHVARQVKTEIEENQSLFDFRQSQPCLLLILDRMDDPVTPLLTQWTYQAMVHELLGMHNNIVKMKSSKSVDDDGSGSMEHNKKQETKEELAKKEYVVLSVSDPFYEQHMFSNYGDLAEAVKNLLGTFQKHSNSNKQISSIQDMQEFLEKYPEIRKMSNTVANHVAVVSELVRIIGEHGLLDMSALEQDLACTSDHATHFERVKAKIMDPSVAKIDALRLTILYALRYETNGANQIQYLKKLLSQKGYDSDDVNQIDAMINYAGASKRGGDLFGDKDMLSKTMRIVNRTIKGVQNVFTQHKPVLSEIIEQIKANKLKEANFPFVVDGAIRDRPKEVIIFIVGGATFEEAAKVAEFNASSSDLKILLGGTTIHNSKSFMDEVQKIA